MACDYVRLNPVRANLLGRDDRLSPAPLKAAPPRRAVPEGDLYEGHITEIFRESVRSGNNLS